MTEGLGGFFWFHTVRNTGNGPIGGVIEDVMPCPVVSPASASPVCATPGFHLHSFGFTVGPAPVQIDWVASDGSSGSYAVTASDVAAAVVLAGALGMPPGTELASFRAVYAETIPAGTSTQLLVNGNLTNAFPANTYTQTNCGSFRMTAAGTTYPPGGLQCPVAAFRDPRIVWGSSKWAESRSGGYFTFPNVTNLQPGQGIIWRLTATNWGEVASTPQIVDLLPASLDYDPSVPVTAYVHPLNPGTLKPLSGVSVIATPDYNGTGRTLLRVVFPPGFTVPAYSSTADISVSVWVGTSIRAGTTIGSYTNEAQVYDAGGAFGCVNDWSVADLDNLSGLGTDLRLCPGAATFTVAASANAGARKLVKGDRDADFLAGVGQSLAGGSSQWQISVGNYGNSTPLTDVVAYDIFPYVGDTGVSAGQVGVPRLSQFAPTLQDPVNAPAGVTISYSQSTNPCRPELIPTGPAGCVDDWTTTFPGPGLVKAIRIDGGSTVLAPGQLITVTYPMALPATADGGQIAWNSVAFRATRTDDGQPSLPTEPSKVGIQIVSASIGDVVWLDVDRDGRQGDPAVERPLGAVPVNLYAADGVTMLDSVTTGANGYYSFLGLTAGRDYVVEFGRLPGMGFTIAHAGADGSDSDADPGTGRVTVTAPTTGGANLPSDGAGQWADDPSIDAGLVGVNLTATKQLRSTGRLLPGTTVEFVVTPHNDGSTDALAGWSVTEVLPAGLTMVSMTGAGYTCAGVTCTAGDRLPAGGDGAPVTVLARIEPDAADSLRNVAYVAPAAAEVLEGRPLGSPPGPGTDTGLTDTDNDAHAELTVTPLVSVGDFVWLDVDRDGVQDDGEPPVPGVVVHLLDAEGTVVAQTTTDAAGWYSFDALVPGAAYTMEFVKPAGMSLTTPDAGSSDEADSDVDPVTARVSFTAPAQATGSGTTLDDPSIDGGLVGVNLIVTKQLRSAGPWAPGASVEYLLTPRNDGPADALAGWSVTEVLPAGLTLVSMTGTGYTCTGATCTAGDRLPAGATGAPITVTATLGTAVTGTVRNVAFVSPAPSDVAETNPLAAPPGADADTGASATDNDAHADLVVATPLVVTTDLAQTGAELARILLLGVGLVGAGALLRLRSRRRRGTGVAGA